MTDWRAAHAVLQRGCDDKVFPGAAAEVGSSDGVRWRANFGATRYDAEARAVDDDTLYDLASLTKVIATTTVALTLFDRGVLDLATRVGAVVPEWQGLDRDWVTLLDLLEHASGLPEWRPLHRTARGTTAFVSAIASEPLAYAPRAQSVYSDLGFILLAAVLERIAGDPLDQLTARALGEGIGADVTTALTFGVRQDQLPHVAPTHVSDERGTLAPGAVDDTNAWALGGVAGHAGLFGAVGPVGAFAAAMLRASRPHSGARRVVASPASVSQFLRPSTVPGSSRALGWDLMRPTSSCGTRMSAAAFGHTGFTGTSIWIDPDADVYCVLLSNRVHPTAGDPDGIRTVRRAFHDAVMATLV
jgi:CubicO group peptidase (beta-lactamase class C family)